MSKLGIITAYYGELQSLVEGWAPLDLRSAHRGHAAWRGRIGATECIAVAGGMGKDRAAEACAIAESASGGLAGLVSMGWAGALSPEVHAAQVYAVTEVIDADTEERFSSAATLQAAPSIKLVTIGHVAQAGEKRQLAEKYHAVLVDMEAAAVAQIAMDKSIAFYCFKAVSDAYDDALLDFGRYVGAEGQIRIRALLAHIALRPKYWPAMARMGKNTKTGTAALAAALRDFLGQHANNA